LIKKFLGLATGVVATVSIAACTERLESGATACPLLCPQQAINLRDTTIDAVIIDTTVHGLPPIGSETYMMLASYGDSLDSRAIIRYDTLPQSYTKLGVDSTIVKIDTAQLIAPVLLPDSAHRPKVPITIEAYNVDTTEADTVSSVLSTLFRPSRLIGSRTFAPESLSDTLKIPISVDTVLDRVKSGTRLRIGLRLVSSVGVDLRIATGQAGTPVRLRIKASLDTSVAPVQVSPLSATPADQDFVAGPLADYTIIVRGVSTTPRTLLGVGGVPSRRVFLKFLVPSHIVDSTSIVRASLLLTQSPNRRLNLRDSVFILPVPILSTGIISDFGNALQFLSGTTGAQLGLDSLKLAPGDSGVRSFEIVGLVRTWRQQPETVSPRTLALVSASEGQQPNEIDFFSTKALAAVRPRLRITYVPPTGSGLP
jgi:hypothetical protein